MLVHCSRFQKRQFRNDRRLPVDCLPLRGCLKSPSSEEYRDVMPRSINSGKCYDTDLSEAAWRLIEPMLPAVRPGGRPRTTNLRSVLNAIFYLLRTGSQWRLLPREFPAWSTVYHYFRSWNNGGLWSSIQRLICQQAPRASWPGGLSVGGHHG